MNAPQKLLYYEYCLDQFMKWHSEETGRETPNDISILKSLKLLFFLSAVESNSESNNTVLDLIFDKFSALPYGHVEIDVYSSLQAKKGNLEYFTIGNSGCERNKDKNIKDLNNSLDKENKALIDRSFLALKRQNSKLIVVPAFDLVNLSHQWYSWRYTFSQARKNAANSMEIPTDRIKKELKLFRL